jgi:outer membrane receptor for ferrienterochelin and colicin
MPRSLGLLFEPDTQQNSENSTPTIQNSEGALYLETSIALKHDLNLNIGARESFYNYPNLRLNFEPRLSFHKQFANAQSLQASYARMNQYVNLLSNTGIGLPTDLWVPATDKIPYSQSDQFALSYTKDRLFKDISLTFEAYYKSLRNIVLYKDGASFLDLSNLNNKQKIDWENDLTTGKGWTYGYEWLLQKKVGKLTGLMAYTLSWAIHRFDEINEGKPFYATNDRRHNLEMSASYALNRRVRLSLNALYMSGNMLTVPNGVYFNEDAGNSHILYYDKRNNFRAEDYHRVDIGIQFHKKKKWGERYLDISIYNVYNRKNPFYYSTFRRMAADKTYKVGLTRNWLLPILPSISYNFKF